MANSLPSPSDMAYEFLEFYPILVIQDKGIWKVWGGGLNPDWKGSNLEEFVHINLEKFLKQKGIVYTSEYFQDVKSLIISRSIPK